MSKTKWNVDPDHPVTLLRLISEIEGCIYFLDCLDGAEEEKAYLEGMRAKYYKSYFRHPDR